MQSCLSSPGIPSRLPNRLPSQLLATHPPTLDNEDLPIRTRRKAVQSPHAGCSLDHPSQVNTLGSRKALAECRPRHRFSPRLRGATSTLRGRDCPDEEMVVANQRPGRSLHHARSAPAPHALVSQANSSDTWAWGRPLRGLPAPCTLATRFASRAVLDSPDLGKALAAVACPTAARRGCSPPAGAALWIPCHTSISL